MTVERSADPSASVLVHVVLISFREAATVDQRREMFDLYQTLGQRCGGEPAGLLFWQVSENLDSRKNWSLVELAIFRDDAALQAFRSHPAHAAHTQALAAIADWAVGDIESAGLAGALRRA